MESKDFNVFVPIDSTDLVKSIEGDEKGNYVRGWASTPDLDRQGDIIDPKGINISSFLQQGWINYEHQAGDDFKIGVPTKNSYVDPKNGLFVEAKLMMSNPHAEEMWELATNMAKSNVDRPLGFSVEGSVVSRDREDSRIISGVNITNVALTTHPANPEATWEQLVKSLTTGTGIAPEDRVSAGALRRQSLAKQLRVLTYSMADMKLADWKEIAKSMDEEDRFDSDVAITLLQLSTGLSKQDAMKKLNLEGE